MIVPDCAVGHSIILRQVHHFLQQSASYFKSRKFIAFLLHGSDGNVSIAPHLRVLFFELGDELSSPV